MKVIGRGQGGRAAVWIAMLAIFGTRTVQAGINQWTPIGPFGGSARALAIDPQNPDTVYAGTSGGVFKTTNGGTSWKISNSGLPAGHIARTLVIDPGNPNTVYAGGECGAYGACPIFKSTDGAKSWSPINSGLEAVIVVESLAIDPQNAGTLYAGTSACFQASGAPGWVEGGQNFCHRPGVFKTTDGGSTWIGANSGLPWDSVDFMFIHAVTIDPQDSKTIYAASGGGVFKSTDGGASWKNSLLNRGGAALIIDPQNPGTLYAAGWNGVLKTTDGGANWNGVNSGLPENCCGSLVINPQNPNTIYAGGRYDQAYADGRFGIFVSNDGGRSWANTGMSWRNTVLTSFPIDPPNPSVTVALDPQNPGTVYAATGCCGVFKSSDRASSWNAVNSGFSATEVHSTAFDPRHPGTIFAATNAGLFKSTDGGANWGPADSGLPKSTAGFGSAPRSMVIDPQNPSTLYAGIRSTSFMNWPSIPYPLNGGIFKSTNGGADWSAVGSPPAGGFLLGLLGIDPQSSTVYAAGASPPSFGTLFQSTDGGTNWTSSGSFVNAVTAFAIDPQIPRTLYVADGWRVMKSIDRGENWNDLPVPLGNCDECLVSILTIDPRDSSTVYACGSIGVLKSVDRGATWNAMNSGLPSPQFYAISSFVIDPDNSNNVYVAIAGRVFRSTDGAASWSEVNAGWTATTFSYGYNFGTHGSQLTFDPTDPSTLYVGTSGGGIHAITFVPETNLNQRVDKRRRLNSGGIRTPRRLRELQP